MVDSALVQAHKGLFRNNQIINSNFDFWQRNNTFSISSMNIYTADRFAFTGTLGAATVSISRQAFTIGQTEVPNEPTYYLRWNETVGSADARSIGQRIEFVRTLNTKEISFSFWLKTSSVIPMTVDITQNFGTGGSPSVAITVLNQAISTTTSWKKYTITTTLPSISGKTLGTNLNDHIHVKLTKPASVSSAIIIDTAQWMLNEGKKISQHSLATNTYAAELDLCKRFYEKSYDLNTNPGTITPSGYYLNGPNPNGNFQFSNKMISKRATPTAILYSDLTGAAGFVNDGNVSDVATAATFIGQNAFSVNGVATVNGSVKWHWTADAEIY